MLVYAKNQVDEHDVKNAVKVLGELNRLLDCFETCFKNPELYLVNY